MQENKHAHRHNFPILTLMLVVGSLLLFLLPDTANLLIYDRERIFSGEVWRLATGALVHFSWPHVVYNAVILLIAGSLLERDARLVFVALVLITSIASGLYFLFFLPDMTNYAGLSAINSALVIYLCLMNIRDTSISAWLWIMILILFIAKVTYEIVMQQAFFVSFTQGAIQVVPSAHIIGALTAVTLRAWDAIAELRIQHKN